MCAAVTLRFFYPTNLSISGDHFEVSVKHIGLEMTLENFLKMLHTEITGNLTGSKDIKCMAWMCDRTCAVIGDHRKTDPLHRTLREIGIRDGDGFTLVHPKCHRFIMNTIEEKMKDFLFFSPESIQKE